MKMRVICLISILLFAFVSTFAQNVSISEDESYTPDAAAMLDVYSLDKGLLIPRIALVSTVSPISGTKPDGLMVYNTSTSGTYSTPGFYYWDGADWVMVGSTAITFSNGLTESSNEVKLGGTLTEATTITNAGYNMIYNLSSTGDFDIQDNGSTAFFVRDDGNIGIGTNSPQANMHLIGDATLGSFLITPSETTSQDDSELQFGEDNDYTYGMSIKYDGVDNELQVFGKSSTNSFGPHIAIDRNDGYVGIGDSPSETSAILEVISTNKGVLVPRMTTTQRNSISSPANGLLVYDTTVGSFFYYNSSKSGWVNLAGSVDSDGSETDDEALFSVVNAAGDTVFAVYPEGVQINVGDGTTKGTKGGFAVAGITSGKAPAKEFLRVTPDSVRVYVDTTTSKGTKGGFAVAGITSGKGITEDFLRVTGDSVRIYVKEGAGTKGTKGGFAVAGITSGKGYGSEYLRVTTDSVRVYVDPNGTKGIKGTKGGFAVAGITSGKGIGNDYLRITNDSVRIYVEEGAKGTKGGFAVAGITSGKGTATEIMKVTKDSTRIFVKDPDAGFSIGNTESGSEQSLMKLTKENYFIGHESGIATVPGAGEDGRFNSFFGFQSGKSNSTGNSNVFIGYQVGIGNTEGHHNVFIGSGAATDNLTGADNVIIGANAGKTNSSGASNVFVGDRAGNFNTSGSNNVFLGNLAGANNSSGGRNIFIGYVAGFNNGVNSSNVFIGDSVGYDNTGGTSNIFMGISAGRTNTTGDQNIFIGERAGYKNTSGYLNTYVGFEVGYKSVNAHHNSIYGYRAGYNNAYGDQNNFFGYEAGYKNSSGNYNNFFGYQAGYSTTTGDYNTFIGPLAGYGNTGGNYNIYLGYQAGYSSTGGDYNFFAGYKSGYSNSSGSSNTFLGYRAGTSNSTGGYNIFVGHDAGKDNTVGDQNTFVGYTAGNANTTADDNTFVGWAAGQVNQTGVENTYIGTGAGAYSFNGNQNTFVGYGAGYGNGSGNSGSVFIGYKVGYSNVGANKLMIDNNDVTSSTALIYGDFSTNYVRFNADVTINELMNLSRQVISVTSATGTIYPTASFVALSPNTNKTLSGGISITDRTTGTVLIITNISSTYAVTILDNSNVQLSSGNMVLGLDDTLMLIHDGSEWIEISRSNN